MPAPSAPWQLIRVTGHFRDFAGAELNGTVTFAPSQRAIDYANNIIVLPSTLTATVASGILYGPDAVAGILIPATNDPDITPAGWTYTVTETMAGQGSSTVYSVAIPYDAAGATIDITDLVPVTAVPNTSPYVLTTDIAALTATVTSIGSKAARVLDLKDFAGVVGDGANDDTAGIQLAVNSVTGASAGVPAVYLRVTPGTYRITSQISINRKAIIFEGAGVGNPTAYTGNPGKGSTFQWGGLTGGYMFEFEDATNCGFRDILFQGNVTTPPGAFVSAFSNGGGSGLNEFLFFERCRFGRWPWSNVVTPAATLCATAGILYRGTNANNDKPVIRDCRFDNVGVGIDLPNTQSEWGFLDNPYFSSCTVAGVRTSTNITINNGRWQQCAVDVIANSTAHVHVYGHWSENSGQMVQLNGQGFYGAHGGLFLFSASLGTNWLEHNSCGAEGGVYLSGLHVSNPSGTYTGKKLYVRGASGAVQTGSVTIIDCPGVVAGMLDIQAAAAGAGIRLFVKTGTLDLDHMLLGSQSLATVGSYVRGELLAGGGETTFSRQLLNAQAQVQITGSLTLTYFEAMRPETINNLTMITAGTAAAGLTLCRLGVYSVNPSSGDLTLIASTVSDTSLFAATFTRYTKALSAGWVKAPRTVYALGVLPVGTTMPALYADNSQGAAVINTTRGIGPRISAVLTGQSDLPSSISAGLLGVSRINPYVEMTP